MQMQNNPVKQRVKQLEELWSEFAFRKDYADARIFCWMGSSLVDYRMIKSFVMVQLSDEAELADTFMCNHLNFQKSNAGGYGRRLVLETQRYIDAYNANDELSAVQGKVMWTPLKDDARKTDAAYLVENLNELAKALKVAEGEEYLVLALLPEPNYSPHDYATWLEEVINSGLSNLVRLMVYDTYGSKFYEQLEKRHGQQFKRLYPDLDMPGAMSQVAEQAETIATNEEDKDMAGFQKNLLKMNIAIAQTDAEAVATFRVECLNIAKRRAWPHMEALVNFFMHNFFYAANDFQNAEEAINKAIQKGDEAYALKLADDVALRCQYRTAKGNLYFFQKLYAKAAAVYQDTIQIIEQAPGQQNSMMVNGILQMLAMSLFKEGEKEKARSTFEKGWLLVAADAQLLKENKVIMYYAQQMMEAGMHKQEKYEPYFNTMNAAWGKDWHKKLETHQKELKYEYS